MRERRKRKNDINGKWDAKFKVLLSRHKLTRGAMDPSKGNICFKIEAYEPASYKSLVAASNRFGVVFVVDSGSEGGNRRDNAVRLYDSKEFTSGVFKVNAAVQTKPPPPPLHSFIVQVCTLIGASVL